MQSVALSIQQRVPIPGPTNRKNRTLSSHAVSRSFNHNSDRVLVPVPTNRNKNRTLLTCSQSLFQYNSESRSQAVLKARTALLLTCSKSLFQSQQRVPIPVPTNRKNRTLSSHAVSRSFNHNSESWSQCLPTLRTALCSHAVSRSFNHNSESRSQSLHTARTELCIIRAAFLFSLPEKKNFQANGNQRCIVYMHVTTMLPSSRLVDLQSWLELGCWSHLRDAS